MSDSTPDPERVDGRRLRSEANRARIVQAMIEIVSEGPMGMPSAEMVADRAGVGLRTVFRLFEDMDGVYRGMQSVLMERFAHMLAPLQPTGDWRRDVQAEVARRSELYEGILPLQIAADAQRHRSAALQEGRARMVRLLRESLAGLLPDSVRSDRARFAMLELVASFEAWRRLRLDQAASVEEARALMVWGAKTLLDDVAA